MRYSAFSLYPVWLKPLLVSLGAMFVATAIFLIILIWKSSPTAAAAEGQAVPAFTLQPVSPSAAIQAPAAQPAPIPAPTARSTMTPVHSKPHHKVAHHVKKSRKHARMAKASRSSRKSDDDALSALLR